jgi:cyclic pyranopterin phosphate synthase
VDSFGRAHTYVRVSVTDRCNYRCTYCMPSEGLQWMPRAHLLTYEEIARIVAVMASMGVHRVRLTGGEPTIRAGLEHLVGALAAIEGIDDLSMTTNAHLLASKAQLLADAGLSRINVSLDAVDADIFRQITRGGDLQRVLAGIDAAVEAGLTPVKINAVVVAGLNEHQVPAMVDHFAPYGDAVVVRFIEYMPFGGVGEERRHVSAEQLRAMLPGLRPVQRSHGGPATTYQLPSGQVVGFISPITEHFCHTCNRLRLAADGHLRTCLSRDKTPSLRDLLRDGASDRDLEAALRAMVWGKVAGHEAHRVEGFRAFEGVMTRVGG